MNNYILKFTENDEIPLETNPAYFAGFNVYHRLNLTDQVDEALTYLDHTEASEQADKLNEIGFTVTVVQK